MTGAATIRDVALRAAVSTATVSRVLSRPERVAAATRDRVLQAVRDLGYAPNSAAKSLRTLRAAKILVTVPDISNPFFSMIIRGVEDAAQAAGYAVLLGDTRHDPEREELYAAMLGRREADGLIFLGHRLPDALTAMIADLGPRAPVVNGCEFSPDLGVSSVHIDNAAAAGEMVEHLARLGHRRIGLLTGPLASPISRERLAGARAAAARAGVALAAAEGDFSVESGAAGAALLLDGAEAPTALFCFSDEMAMGALALLRARGLSCPAAVSVAGFDDIRFARHLDPPLTTVRQPMTQIGRETVRLLLEILAGETRRPEVLTLPHALVARASTGPPPGG